MTVLAAVLRFPTLDSKSYWFDEAVTVWLLRKSFGEMLSTIPASESTPPLYYVLAWGWTRVFGTGEVGLRSLSALLGTALVLVVYTAAASLISRRGALIAALLVAVNPLLVWYSQEARSYALFVLLASVSFLYFVRASRGEARSTRKWAVASVLALCTQYFSVVLVVPQAAWLMARRPRREVTPACALLALTAVALTPLAVRQRSHGMAGFIGESSLVARLLDLPQFLLGFEGRWLRPLAVASAVLALVSLWLLLTKGKESDRRGAAMAGLGALGVVGISLAGALAGLDYFFVRNLIPASVLVIVVLAAGFAVQRGRLIGLGALTALCIISLAIVISTRSTPKYGVEEWRSAAESVDRPGSGRRMVVVAPSRGVVPLEIYLRSSRPFPDDGASVSEIVLVALAQRGVDQPAVPAPPGLPEHPAPPARGFFLVQKEAQAHFSLLRFRSARPRRVEAPQAKSGQSAPRAAAVLMEG